MPEFLNLLPPAQALERLLTHLPVSTWEEEIDCAAALGRVTAQPVVAAQPLPGFRRATVDGYALQAAATFGANESMPAYLALLGEVAMGSAPTVQTSIGQCALIHTGGMLPAGADAVVMLEHTQAARPGEIEVLRALAPGENVLQVGEDVQVGQEVIPAGIRLRPAEIGGLMALGITRINVARKPQVGILSSGDEIVTPDQALQLGQVHDVNAYTLSSLVEQAGGEPRLYGIIPDRADLLLQAARGSLAKCELLAITAGSSASTRDLTAQVINDLGSPGVLVHGVNVRPGKPTILGVCGGKAVIGLPGNPVSALVIAQLFVVPVVEALLGNQHPRLRARVAARLALNLNSQAGREDWVAVRLLPDEGGYRAEPVFGQSNLIFTLARADGLLRIPPDATGLSAGTQVDVELM